MKPHQVYRLAAELIDGGHSAYDAICVVAKMRRKKFLAEFENLFYPNDSDIAEYVKVGYQEFDQHAVMMLLLMSEIARTEGE